MESNQNFVIESLVTSALTLISFEFIVYFYFKD